jgi:hypothetical protein
MAPRSPGKTVRSKPSLPNLLCREALLVGLYQAALLDILATVDALARLRIVARCIVAIGVVLRREIVCVRCIPMTPQDYYLSLIIHRNRRYWGSGLLSHAVPDLRSEREQPAARLS